MNDTDKPRKPKVMLYRDWNSGAVILSHGVENDAGVEVAPYDPSAGTAGAGAPAWVSTPQLRWVEQTDNLGYDESNKPAATLFAYTTHHYKLQQKWVAESGAEEWRDVPVDRDA